MMLEKLLASIDSKKFSNHVVSLSSIGPVGKKIKELGVPTHALQMPHGRVTLDGLVKLWQLIRSIRPTILQTWLYHADFLGLLFGKFAGVSNICWNIRCSYIDFKKYRLTTRWTFILCRLLSFLPQAVITNSEAALTYHVKYGYKVKHWKVIPNAFEIDKFKPDKFAKLKLLVNMDLYENNRMSSNKGQDKKDIENVIFIGYISRYDPMKDHATFLRAAILLLNIRKDVHFVMVGKNITWNNELLVKQIPIKRRNHFHLIEERDDIDKITAALDIASSVSFGESFPNIVGEAMSCGVPCVVTDVGDSARIVGKTGLVVPPNDPEALAEAWEKLIDIGVEERKKLGTKARKRIIDCFELSLIVRKYEEFYSSLAIKGRSDQR